MSGAVDAFVDTGGLVARFAGNFLWQIRLEDDGRRQVEAVTQNVLSQFQD